MFDEWSEVVESPLMENTGFLALLGYFILNTLVVFGVIRMFYYPKSRRRDYVFTFMLISISIFLMIFLLGNVKLKVGFALGLFAIFGIIRYRTESMPVREMTYLFVIIAVSVINALGHETLSFLELVGTNLLFVLSILVCESTKWMKHVACKLVLYDRIELIHQDRKEELLADLRERTGLDICRVEVGHIDFLRDVAMLKVHYNPHSSRPNTVDTMVKFPKENE
ncbi:DUF4956 domain-containing protein [Bacteroides acidifaciens]|uniref:DUF4956 domain-containing protein n=1 Tax=Bacteroides acidifaciens TaxID=85831 RepID=UPI0025928C73|nr:DUF4956 domain-containing protein [Bacteroides acidifaciens]